MCLLHRAWDSTRRSMHQTQEKDLLQPFPSLRTYVRRGLQLEISCKHAADLGPSELEWMYALCRSNMEALYQPVSTGCMTLHGHVQVKPFQWPYISAGTCLTAVWQWAAIRAVSLPAHAAGLGLAPQGEAAAASRCKRTLSHSLRAPRPGGQSATACGICTLQASWPDTAATTQAPALLMLFNKQLMLNYTSVPADLSAQNQPCQLCTSGRCSWSDKCSARGWASSL